MNEPKTWKSQIKNPGVVVVGMLLLILAQLTWWLIFFRISSEEHQSLRRELDSAMIELAGNPPLEEQHTETLARYGIIEKDGQFILSDEEIKKRNNETERRMIMLKSETAFVVLLLIYASYRVIRSVNRERALHHERSMFLNSVTHELKTPIAAVRLSLQTLQKRKVNEEKQLEILQVSLDELARLERQINNLLLGSQNHNQQGKSSFENTLYDLIEERKNTIEQAGARLHIHIENGMLAIHQNMLRAILDNIIQNSILYAEDKPEITIFSSVIEGNFMKIQCSDNGRGINPDEIGKVFQPLYRGNIKENPVRGTGMGLYIVKQIVESANGTVQAFSEGNGKGTTIEIKIPLAMAEA